MQKYTWQIKAQMQQQENQVHTILIKKNEKRENAVKISKNNSKRRTRKNIKLEKLKKSSSRKHCMHTRKEIEVINITIFFFNSCSPIRHKQNKTHQSSLK